VLENPRTRPTEVRSLVLAIKSAEAEHLPSLRDALWALRSRFAQRPVNGTELDAALTLVGRRNRRQRDAEQPQLAHLVALVAERYRSGELAPTSARSLKTMLMRQPEYGPLADALIERGLAGDPEALNALWQIQRESELTRAMKALHELGQRIAAAGLPRRLQRGRRAPRSRPRRRTASPSTPGCASARSPNTRT
jgi:hypothetical protein